MCTVADDVTHQLVASDYTSDVRDILTCNNVCIWMIYLVDNKFATLRRNTDWQTLRRLLKSMLV